MNLRLVLLFALFACETTPPTHDCDGAEPSDWYRDDDGDGFGVIDRVRPACEAPAGFVAISGDCDDTDPSTFPDAPERCGGGDDDCDGTEDEDPVDPLTWYPDSDLDGFGGPDAPVTACTAPAGYLADATDCDDADAEIHPEAHERCDEADRDCDGDPVAGAIDATAWYPDVDGDGYGEEGAAVGSCDEPEGDVAVGGDCDDTDPGIHPGADEWCDEVDQDCDGDPEAGAVDMPTWYADADGDGYGGTRVTQAACVAPEGYVAEGTDCNDLAGGIHPGAPEFCDDVDHDCDGDAAEADSVDAVTWYTDADGDRYGDPTLPEVACTLPAGTSPEGTDCDDADPDAYPGAPEVCDGVDHDCDGATLEADSTDAVAWFADADGDGFGDADAPLGAACAAPADAVADACDCDDTDAAYNPDAADCDTVTCSGGGEVWLDDSCGLREITATATGSIYSPVELSLDEASTVWFCAGTHDVAIRGTGGAAVSLVGVGGATSTALRSGVGTLVQTDGALSIEGLTLALGYSTTDAGAAIDTSGDVSLVDSEITGAESTYNFGSIVVAGGDLAVDGVAITANQVVYSSSYSSTCGQSIVNVGGDLTLADSEISGNSLSCESLGGTYTANLMASSVLLVLGDADLQGGAVEDNLVHGYSGGMSSVLGIAAGAYVAGDLTLQDSSVARNVADAGLDCSWTTCSRSGYGGGVYVGGDLAMVDSLILGNEVLYSGTTSSGTDVTTLYGGGVFLEDGSFSCTSTDGGDHGVFGNSAGTAGGGLYWMAPGVGATLTSSGCDWTGSADNTPDDIAGAASWSGDDNADFVCDEAGVCVQ